MGQIKDIHYSYMESIELLKELSTEKGFIASKKSNQNYRRFWARDGVIAGLASLISDDKELISTFRKHLYTLKKHQDKIGRIPSNVSFDEKRISYGTLVGKIDATLWFIIGACRYYLKTKDESFLADFKLPLEKSFFYLEAIELNGKGLLYMPTGGDWADEYVTHGYVLFDQILYFQAIKDYEKFLIENKERKKSFLFKIKKNKLKKIILVNYFPKKTKIKNKYVYHKGLYRKILEEFKEEYALSYFSSDGCSKHMDGFANSLILNMGDDFKKEKIKISKYLNKKISSQKIKIIPAFWPPITPKEKYLWKILETNSLFHFKNKPHYYHNGGLWPVIHGFFISGLKNEKQKDYYLREFSKILEETNYEFHEYFESLNYTPQGIKKMAYTASGYMIAYLSVIKKIGIFD